MLTLHKSPHAGPFHTRNVKMNETKSTAYCNRFKVRKYTFGECCKFKHEINPEFKHRESVLVEKKFTQDKKKLPNTNIKRIFNPNNYHNSITGQPRGNHAAEQPPKYSNEQIINIKNSTKTNGKNEEKYDSQKSNNSTRLFSNPLQLQEILSIK